MIKGLNKFIIFQRHNCISILSVDYDFFIVIYLFEMNIPIRHEV